MCLIIEEPSGERLQLLASSTGRIQNDRNVVTMARQLIQPMGNMPLYKEIIMFEKIQNKNNYKSHSCCTCFYLTKENQPNTPTNRKSKQSTKNLSFTACVVSSQFEVKKEFFEQKFLWVSSLIFLHLPSIRPTGFSIPYPAWIHRLLPPLSQCTRPFMSSSSSSKLRRTLKSKPFIVTDYWLIIF